jgi:hypothetical protein
MKNFLILFIVFACITPTHAQFLKKIKDKVNKTVDKKIDKAVGIDKPTTEIEKKEDAASDQYSDVTENNERPIFVDKAPDNGKMILQLKKDDLFWGGYIQLKEQPKKAVPNTTILDYVLPRVGSLYTKGEISSYAIYVDGKRTENDSSSIPLRPTFMSYDVNKTPCFTSTEAKVGTPDPMAAVATIQAKGNKPVTKEEEAEFAKTVGGQITQPTFTFKYNGKTYGPFEGSGENMFVLKSMTDGKPTEKFYGFGAEMVVAKNEKGKSQIVINGLVQTEKKVLRIKDYMITTLAPTYPAGTMAFALGGKVNTFSNGKTVAINKIAGIADGLMNVYTADNKYYSEIYGTDSGHVVSIVKLKDNTQAENTTEAWVDYTTKLTYPVNITKQHLLLATNPAKSVLYNMHTLYYADGTKKTIDNVGDAQLIKFNGKEYIVWFEMMKVADGHEIYVCQKELK